MSESDKIKHVEPISPDILTIESISGKSYRVSLAEPMAQIAGFAALRDPEMFATVKVVDYGWTVEWDCGLSMACERLVQMAKEQAGEAVPVAEFKSWMQRNGLSSTAAAEKLGLSRRSIDRYSSGARPIPKIVGLACRAIEQEYSISSIRRASADF